jgi:hypothetical protein
MNRFFPAIQRWNIPLSAWHAAFCEMAIDGRLGNEGTAFWIGKRENGVANVTSLAIIRGNGIHKRPDLIVIADVIMHQLTDVISGSKNCVLGQIHSHGISYGVDLSKTDREHTLSVPGFISIVAPNFALEIAPPAACGIHVYESDTGFRRFTSDETQHRIVLSNTSFGPIVTVGT